MIKNSSFFVTQAFMVNELQLKGTELLIYAIIYGFSQEGEGCFEGSIQYLQEWTGVSRETVKRTLQKLCDSGLIIKLERSGRSNLYKANCSKTDPAQNEPTTQNEPTAQNDTDPAQNEPTTRLKMSPDNIDNNINIYIEPAREETPKSKKHKYGEYKNVLLTDEELSKLKQKFPSDYNRRIERLSEYIATHKRGSDYKNHFAVICTWARRDAERGQPQQSGDRPEYDDSVINKLLAKGGFTDERTAV